MSTHKTRIWIKSSTLREIIDSLEHDECHHPQTRLSTGAMRATRNKFSMINAHSFKTDQFDDDFGWGWVLATILSQSPTTIEVYIDDDECHHCHRQTLSIPTSSLPETDMLPVNSWTNAVLDDPPSSIEGDTSQHPPENMIGLVHLHEPAVVHCLRHRYHHDIIYTSTGPILLAVNPFKRVGDLYSDDMMDRYWKESLSSSLSFDGGGDGGSGSSEGEASSLPPHVFQSAINAFDGMMAVFHKRQQPKPPSQRRLAASDDISGSDQSILVSGESGSGKTVSTKYIMHYLAVISDKLAKAQRKKKKSPKKPKLLSASSVRLSSDGKRLPRGSISRTKTRDTGKVEERIVQSNPILESFGNARTVRNDNSSRFGKFIQLQFRSNGTLAGAAINTYLLEKVRLVTQGPGERNYHIFYELLEGATPEDREMLHLSMDSRPEDFKLTSKSGTYDRRDGVQDIETFEALVGAFSTLGFNEFEENYILSVVAALLHASNITFRDVSEDECELDEENESLTAVLELMEFDRKTFGEALCKYAIYAGREKHIKNLNAQKAARGLLGLIKATYASLFEFLVDRINRLIRSEEPNLQKTGGSIGVLDIFGFESFKTNSFEQLCINYCNEALQQQFNLFIFKNEQEEYTRENIRWDFISFPDNQDVLDFIDNHKRGSTSLLSLLDGHCRAPGATARGFALDLYKKCGDGQVSRFSATNQQKGRLMFNLLHYAGNVEYTIEGFLEKNRDEIPRETTELLLSSENLFISDLAKFIDPSTATATKPKKKTSVGRQFSMQLRDLRSKIDQTAPHYVRCLKPNDELVPNVFNARNISGQLTCAGVIEAVRVSRVGFPQRFEHEVFLRRYGLLSGGSKGSVQVQCEALVKSLNDMLDDEEGIQMGRTKVFLRSVAYTNLEDRRQSTLSTAVITIQATARMYLSKRVRIRILKAIIKIQCWMRQCLAWRECHERRKNRAVTVITAYYRRMGMRREYKAILTVVRWGQRRRRGILGRRRYDMVNRETKAITIQTAWRRYWNVCQWEKMTQAVLVIQCAVRCAAARGELRKLRMGARDLGRIKEERDELRKENEMLRVELEQFKQREEKKEECDDRGIDTKVDDDIERRHEEEIEHLKKELELAQAAANDDMERYKLEMEELRNKQREEKKDEGDSKDTDYKDDDVTKEQHMEEHEQLKKELELAQAANVGREMEIEQLRKELEQSKILSSLPPPVPANGNDDNIVRSIDKESSSQQPPPNNDDDVVKMTAEKHLQELDAVKKSHDIETTLLSSQLKSSQTELQLLRDELETTKSLLQQQHHDSDGDDEEKKRDSISNPLLLSSAAAATENTVDRTNKEASSITESSTPTTTIIAAATTTAAATISNNNDERVHDLEKEVERLRKALEESQSENNNFKNNRSSNNNNVIIASGDNTLPPPSLTEYHKPAPNNPTSNGNDDTTKTSKDDEILKLSQHVQRLEQKLNESTAVSAIATDIKDIVKVNEQLMKEVTLMKQQQQQKSETTSRAITTTAGVRHGGGGGSDDGTVTTTAMSKSGGDGLAPPPPRFNCDLFKLLKLSFMPGSQT